MPGNIKPKWLNKKIDLAQCHSIKEMLRGLSLNTVCEEARCPNISECFHCGVATIMILGNICTRSCKFCGVNKNKPLAVDIDEPIRVRDGVMRLGLRYVVITSPTRDDLIDGGLGQFIATVTAIKSIDSEIRVEILVPDFNGDSDLWARLAFGGADVVAHNVETIPSLYKEVRGGADYQRSLDLLGTVKKINKNVLTKSGLMLGLGEKIPEVVSVLRDLRAVGCDSLTIGQYLAPSKSHYPVKEYIDIHVFNELECLAKGLGFKTVKCAPYVRSSYLADKP